MTAARRPDLLPRRANSDATTTRCKSRFQILLKTWFIIILLIVDGMQPPKGPPAEAAGGMRESGNT